MRTLVAVMVTLVAWGCGNEITAPGVSVVVYPDSARLARAGQTVQFTAFASDPTGKSVPASTFEWASSDPSVATVTATGLATAVGPGAATITARHTGGLGKANLVVSKATQGCDGAVAVHLDPGASLTFRSEGCFQISSLQVGDRYRVTAIRPPATAPGVQVGTLSLSVTGPASAASSTRRTDVSASGSRGVSIFDSHLDAALRGVEATERRHLELRRSERALTSPGLAPLPNLDGTAPERAAPPRILVSPSTPSTCSAGAAGGVPALLVYEDDNLIFYQDSAQGVSLPITAGQAMKIARYYADYGEDLIAAYFGHPPDVDANGKIIVVATPSASGSQAGYVWSGNFLPRSTCAASNQMEVVFMNATLIRAMDAATPDYQILETLPHEVKHLVSLYNRLAASSAKGSGDYHPDWMEEGTAEIAGELSSRIAWAAVGGPTLGAKVTLDDIAAFGPARAETYGMLLKMARTVWYLSSQPNGLAGKPPGAAAGHSIYGSGWYFARWLGDAYGGAAAPRADSALFRALTDSLTPAGEAGLLQLTGKSFSTLFEELASATTLHGTGAAEGRTPFTSYDFTSATQVLTVPRPGVYPWPVTDRSQTPGASQPATFATATYTGPIGQTGVRVHDFTADGAGQAATLEVRADVPVTVLIARLR